MINRRQILAGVAAMGSVASRHPVGSDAAQKIKGRKRHAVVDTLGLMLGYAILPVTSGRQ